METPFEHLLTCSYKADLIAFLRSHPEVFEEAIALAVGHRQPYAWRAAWLLWSCMENNDPRIRRHYKRFVLAAATASENQQRELFKILSLLEPMERYEGRLFDICVTAWEKVQAQPSVRVNALKLLVMIAWRYPELSRELELLMRGEFMGTFSPAVRKSVEKIMRTARKRIAGKEKL